jgi:hypothetical protein
LHESTVSIVVSSTIATPLKHEVALAGNVSRGGRP